MDVQTLSAYHELLREGRNAPNPTPEQVANLVDTESAAVAADQGLTEARRRSLLGRLGEARERPMDGRTFFAATRLMDRATTGRAAMNRYFDRTARELGISRTQVESEIAAHITAADNAGRGTTAPQGFNEQFAARPENTGVPLDRQTAYALHHMEQRRAAARTAALTRPTISSRRQFDSIAVRSVGYDPQSGRMEVEFHSGLGRYHAYQVSERVHQEFVNAPSVGYYFARRIRSNPSYQYATPEESAAAGTQTQCGTCGQFAGPGHACPVRDSAEERAVTTRRATAARSRLVEPISARQRFARSGRPSAAALQERFDRIAAQRDMTTSDAQAEAAGSGAPGDDLRAEAAANIAAGTNGLREIRRIDSYAVDRNYRGDTGSFRMMNLTQVRTHARTQPVSAEVFALVDRSISGDHIRTGNVEGRILIAHDNGAYVVVACTEPGDSGSDQLRCQCREYRASYDCEHIRATVASVRARMNQAHLRDAHQVIEATEAVTSDIAAEHAASLTGQAASQAARGEPEVMYSENEAAFKEAYKAAKDRIAAGEEAVPYMIENATGGLGARGTGRAFGVELEFTINDNVNRQVALQAIASDLYAAGLSADRSQMPYGTAKDRGYNENHQGGWVFEQDCTVHGEVVTPVMYDTPETWENLQKVCDIIKRHGGEASTKAGSHVHVSAHNYDHTVANHNRLLNLARENEDVIYRLGTNPERGTHRGSRWCRPNRTPSEGYQTVLAARYGAEHENGINLAGVSGRTNDHVEFRAADSSLNPSVIQAQAKMYLAITEEAYRNTGATPQEGVPVGAHRTANRAEHGATRRLTGEAFSNDTAGFRALADRLFVREVDKSQMTALFAATKWQRPFNQ